MIVQRLLLILGLLACVASRAGAEVIPPAPKEFFNDYARVVSAGTAARLNQQLKDFERQTSSQIWVAIYPKMESDSSVEEYTVRVARSWKTGLKGKDNGAVLFVFVQDHKMRIEVGYGLEGPMPDALCKRILDDEISPRLKAGDFDGGMSAGVAAMMAASQGEYKGTGRTVAEIARGSAGRSNPPLVVLAVIVIFIVIFFLSLSSKARRGYGGSGWWIGGGGFGGGGGGGWSGGGGGGGDSGAMGGGGSFGGGGASGSW